MNPLSMETIFIILSGAILVAGVLYWLWSHIQLTQKKVQLLENAVFELRSMLAARGTEPPAPAAAPVMMVGGGGAGPIVEDVIGSSAPAAKPSEYKDLEDDDWHEPSGESDVKNIPLVSTPLDVDDHHAAAPPALVVNEAPREVISEDLMPGGRISVPEGVDAQPLRELTLGDVGAPREDERFRDFFKQPEVARSPESLESMPVKELRRLAEQRGISGAADMRKKEILAALRQQITSAPAPAAAAPAAEVSVEKDDDSPAADDLGTTEAEILE
jgi:hypothetical protein